MPRPIVEVDVFSPEVIVPVGSDPRTASSVEVPFQALADRTLNLKTTVDAMGGRGGVTRFREVADLDALKAIGRDERKNGDIVLVPLLGYYRYDDSYSRLEMGIWRVNSIVPSADNPSYGQWRHTLSGAVGAANYGLVTRDGAGRVGSEQVKNGIIHLEGKHIIIDPDEFYDDAAMYDTSVATILSASTKAGDVVDARVHFTAMSSNDAGTWNLSLKVSAGGGVQYFNILEASRSGLKSLSKATLEGRITVPLVVNAHQHEIILRVQGSAGNPARIAGNHYLSTTVYRP